MAKVKEGKLFKKRSCCQVCGEDLIASEAKDYCIKKKVCLEHLQAETVLLPGLNELHRWCHQCAKFELLTEFEGLRRTCRQRLVKRRKAPGPSISTSDAPASPSGLQSQQQHGNNSASGYAGTSPTCSTTGVAPTAFSSLFDIPGALDTPEMQQYTQQELGGAAVSAPFSEPEAAAAGQMAAMMGLQQPLQAQQQLGFMGMPAAAGVARTLSVADEAFDNYLDALMQHELQQCMQQQHQKQLQQQANTINAPAPQMQFMAPDVTQLATGRFAPVLQLPAAAAYPDPFAAAAFTVGPGSASSCNSSAQVAADAYTKHSQGGQLEPAAYGADRVDACMRRGRRLQELLQKQELLKRSSSAPLGSVGALPCLEIPPFLQGPSRAAMSAHVSPVMPAQFPAMPGHLSVSPQQPTAAWAGLSGMASTLVMTSTPVLLSQPAHAETDIFSMHGMPAQHQGALGLQAQQPQQQQHHQAALAERMARLQSQLEDVSAQIQGLKEIVCSGAQVTGLATVASTRRRHVWSGQQLLLESEASQPLLAQ